MIRVCWFPWLRANIAKVFSTPTWGFAVHIITWIHDMEIHPSDLSTGLRQNGHILVLTNIHFMLASSFLTSCSHFCTISQGAGTWISSRHLKQNNCPQAQLISLEERSLTSIQCLQSTPGHQAKYLFSSIYLLQSALLYISKTPSMELQTSFMKENFNLNLQLSIMQVIKGYLFSDRS